MRHERTAFFDGVGPELYRENPFRITGLPVDATARAIRRRSEELQIKARLGAGPGTDSPLPLDPPPDLDTAQEALQRLRDPVQRLEAELFWFWPTHIASAQGVRNEALDALSEGRIEDAERIWATPAPGRATAVAAHNLAVLAHARALDASVAEPTGRDLWKRALENWRSALADDAFWDLIAARVRAADDPRLGSGTARELRERLPAALLSLGAALAVRTAHDGDLDGARWLAELLRDSGLGKPAARTALRDAAGPVAARVRASGEAALDRVAAKPSRGRKEAAALLAAADTVRGELEAVLSGDDSLIKGVRDDIAATAMRCAVLYVNETHGWKKAIGLLERALSLAVTEPIRAQIRQNLRTVRDNAVYATCWFCKKAADEGRAYEITMYGDVAEEHSGYGSRRITWRRAKAGVPRCRDCSTTHASGIRKVWLRSVAGVALAAGAASALFAAGLVPAAIVVIVVCGIGLIVHMSRTSIVHGLPEDDFTSLSNFPPIRKQLASGWSFGDKPPGVD
jgi:hypothetical protein